MTIRTDSFSGTRNGNAYSVAGGKFDASVRFGTMVGTIQLQRSFDDFATYGVLFSVTNASTAAEMERVLETAQPCKIRFACTAYTSDGPATTVLAL